VLVCLLIRPAGKKYCTPALSFHIAVSVVELTHMHAHNTILMAVLLLNACWLVVPRILFSACFNKSSAVAEMGDHLPTIDIGRKVGGCCTPFRDGERELGPHLHNVAWAEAYLRTKWYPDPSSQLATTDICGKVGDCCAPFCGGGECGLVTVAQK